MSYRNQVNRLTLFVCLLLCIGGFNSVISNDRKLGSSNDVRDLVVENEAIRVTLSGHDGSVRQVYNKLTDQELIDRSTLEQRNSYYRAPFWYILNVTDSKQLATAICGSEFTSFNAMAIANGYKLTWTIDEKIIFVSTVVALPGERYVNFSIKAQNNSNNRISMLLYPWVQGWKTLGTSDSDDWLAIPKMGGFRCKEPFKNFVKGFSKGCYFNPECAQMCAYWDKQGGFGFTTDDISTGPDSVEHWKKLYLFYDAPETDDSLRDYGVRFLHPSNVAGADMTPPFGTRIYALEKDWQEMAGYYKDIVIPNAPWVSKGHKEDRPTSEYAHWLDKSAACIFAMSGRRPEVQKYYDPNLGFHRMMGGPIYWISHYDWSIQNASIGTAYGDECWLDQTPKPDQPNLPYPFYPPSLAALKAAGDHFTPFMNDMILKDQDDDWGSPHNWGKATTGKNWSGTKDLWVMCPHKNSNTKDWHNFEFQLWENFVTDPNFQADGVYTDIGIGTTAMVDCNNPDHGHQTTGWGYSVPAWIKFYQELKQHVSAKKGAPIIFGTEWMSEVLGQTVDVFQMRQGGGVLGEMDGEFMIEAQRAGDAEFIPMHQFIYHGYGPQHVDGWLKLGERYGDIFFYNAARVTLWGSIPQFNYEFSSTEIFTQHGMKQPGYYLDYLSWTKDWYVVDPAPLVWQQAYQFSQEVGAVRTGFGKDYLCWGEMVPVQAVTSNIPAIRYNWENYNRLTLPRPVPPPISGTLTAPQLVYYTWKYQDKKLGYFFANCGKTNLSVTTDIDPSDYGFGEGKFSCTYKSRQDTHSLPHFVGETQLTFTVPSRHIVLVEVE